MTWIYALIGKTVLRIVGRQSGFVRISRLRSQLGRVIALSSMSIALVLSAPGQDVGNDSLWSDLSANRAIHVGKTEFTPLKYRALDMNERVLRETIKNAPLEFTSGIAMPPILAIPLPDSGYGRFAIYDSPIMSTELQRQFPEVKSYAGQGIDDPSATLRISLSPKGFNAFVISPNGSFMVTPQNDGPRIYLSYFVKDTSGGTFDCLTKNVDGISFDAPSYTPEANLTGQTLRSYRVVISATTQFYQFSGNTDPNLIATINTLLNSVNAIYEREVTIRFVFVAWLADRVGTYFPPNQDLNTMKQLNQPLVDNQVGSANYDSGHVFGFSPGSVSGLSEFSALCNNPVKARVASIVNPDLYQSTMVVAHEFGHKFNARHSLSTFAGPCAGANDPNGRFEPGSGSTIMSYAGICPPENLQPFADSVFHVNSISSILNHVDNVFPACGMRTPTGNLPPVISGATGVGAFIPANTPFTLTGFATDPNGDPLTYSWEQYDSGTGLSIFRPYIPMPSSSRTFPSPGFVLDYANVPPTFIDGFLVGEVLPSSTRVLNFALTVRDNRVAAGGTTSGSLQVNVRGDAGPFTVTQPNTNTTWVGNSQQTVTWNVANTNGGMINTANVRISLSTNGGLTFPTVLADSTPNDGSHAITVPNVQSNASRIKVEAVNNIYFDVSNVNFNIVQGCVTSPIVPGELINQTLNTDCSFIGTTRYVDIYTFSGTAGQRIAISMNSSAFDAYLYLANASAQILHEDNNGGGGTNSRIPAGSGYVTLPDTATYSIYATSAGAGSTGAYSVRLESFANTPRPFDFDGDGKTDIGVFRPPVAEWWISRSSNGTTLAAQFGASTDRIVPADYTGDAKTDIAVWRSSSGQWFVLRSENFTYFAFPFGTAGDVPVPADYDGDTRADAAVFRPSAGTWYIQRSSDNGTTITTFGANGDTPVPADYDGDSRADLAIFRPSNGQWWLNRSTAGVIATTFGNGGDKPVPGNYTTDGKADVAFWRPSTGAWFVLRSENFSFFSFPFGTNGDIPAPGDYDGDGRYDGTVFRPSTATWYSERTTAGTLIRQFGAAGDRPIPNAYVP